MLIRMSYVFIFVLAIQFVPNVHSFPEYTSTILDYVPTEPAYLGNSCNLGHPACEGGKQTNAFGSAFRSNGLKWDYALCMKDSDGDGKTNGDELGDPCCTLVLNGPLQRRVAETLSEPGDKSSVTPYASCQKEAPMSLGAESVFTLMFGDKKALLVVTYPDLKSTCFCSYGADITVTDLDGSANSFSFETVADPTLPGFVLPYISPDTNAEVDMRLETAQSITLTPRFINGFSPSPGVSGASKTYSVDRTGALYKKAIDQLAGSVPKTMRIVQVTAGAATGRVYYAPLILWVLVAGGMGVIGLVVQHLPVQWGFAKALRNYAFVPGAAHYDHKQKLATMTVGGALTALLVLGAALATCGLWYEEHKFRASATDKLGLAMLAVPHITVFSMCGALLLVPRRVSPVRLLFGPGFESTYQNFHLLFGAVANWTMVVHGALVLCYWQETGLNDNIAATKDVFWTGAAAGVCMLVGYLFVMPPVVKNFYHVFRWAHKLMPIACILGVVHMLLQKERSPETFAEGILVALCIGLVVVDQLYDTALTLLFGSSIDARTPPKVVDGHVWMRVHKRGLAGWQGGQFCSVTMLGATGSLVSHPFTMVPAPRQLRGPQAFDSGLGGAEFGNAFELIIKVQEGDRALGYQPWSLNLANSIERARAEHKPLATDVIVSGPYGHGLGKLRDCDFIVLVGGGSGVTAIASIAASLPEDRIGGVFWAFRSAALAPMLDHCFAHVPADRCSFHHTSSKGQGPLEKIADFSKPVVPGRADVKRFLKDTFHWLAQSPKKGALHVGVFACGPDPLMQAAWSYCQSEAPKEGALRGRLQVHLAIEAFRFA